MTRKKIDYLSIILLTVLVLIWGIVAFIWVSLLPKIIGGMSGKEGTAFFEGAIWGVILYLFVRLFWKVLAGAVDEIAAAIRSGD